MSPTPGIKSEEEDLERIQARFYAVYGRWPTGGDLSRLIRARSALAMRLPASGKVALAQRISSPARRAQ